MVKKFGTVAATTPRNGQRTLTAAQHGEEGLHGGAEEGWRTSAVEFPFSVAVTRCYGTLQEEAAACRGQHGCVWQLCAAGNHLTSYGFKSGRESILMSAGIAQGRIRVTECCCSADRC